MRRQRRRIELGPDAFMDVCVDEDASPDLLAALRAVGYAAAAEMHRRELERELRACGLLAEVEIEPPGEAS